MHFKSSYIKSDLFKLMEKLFPAICLEHRMHEELGCQSLASDSLPFGYRIEKSYLDLKLM